MGVSLSQLVLILAAIVIAFAWRDFQEAMSLEQLKSGSQRKRAASYPPLARLLPVLPDGASVWIAPIPEANAFVASGRDIFVTEGLNALYGRGALSTEQMAAVLAHELAHIECGHYQRSRRAADAETIGGVVVSRFGLLGRLLYSKGAAVTRAKLSRKAEFEADARAARMLARCGLAPAELAQALRAFERQRGAGEDGGAPRRTSWLATHPPTAERIARLEALAAAG